MRPTPPSPPSATPPQPAPRRGRRRAARFALGIAAGLGLSVVFVSSFVTALLLHLDAPAARRAVAALVSDAASKDLRGRVDVVSIDKISPRALDIGELTLRDPNGRPVLSVYGAHARYNAVSIARALLGKQTVVLDHAFVDRVNVALIDNGEGVPTLVDAVAQKDPKPPKGPGEKTPSTLRLLVPRIDVQAIEVFGEASGQWVHAYGEVEKLSVAALPEATTIVAPRIAIDVAPIAGVLPASTSIDVDGALRLPTHAAEGDLPVLLDRLRLRVATSGARATITASGDQRTYRARIEVPKLTPAALAAFTGGPPPLPVPLSLAADLSGTMQYAEVHGGGTLGGGSFWIDAHADLTALNGDAAVAVRGLDPALVGGPSLAVSTDLVAHARTTERGTELLLAGDGSTALGGQAGTLAVDARALIEPNRALQASGTLNAGLGRAKADVGFHVTKHGKDGAAHATIGASVPAVEELRALHQQPIKGRVDLEGAADVDLGKQTFALTARAHALGFHHPSIAMPNGAVALQAEGTVAEPKFVAAVAAHQLVLSPGEKNPYRLHDVDVRVAGTPKLVAVTGKLSTDAGQHLALSTHLSPTPTGARLVGTKLHVDRGAFVAELDVKEVSLAGGALAVSGLRMSSTAGGLRLDAAYDPKRHRITLNARSTPLDLPLLMHGAGLEDLGIRGTLTIDSRLATIPRKSPLDGSEAGILRLSDDAPRAPKVPTVTSPYLTGHLELDLDNGYVPSVGEVNAHVDVDVEDRLVLGDVGVAIKDLVRIGVHGGALANGRIDDPKSWADAAGHVDLRIPSVDLAKVAAFLAKRSPASPPPQLAGLVDIDGHLERRVGDAAPTGWLTFDTHGLAMLSGATRLEGIDLRLRAALEGEHDEDGGVRTDKPVKVYAVAEARDDKGPLLVVHAGTEGAWSKIKSAGSALGDLPLHFDLVAAPRDIDLYPRSIAKLMPVHGKLGLAGHGEGTIGEPKLELCARLEEIGSAEGAVHDADVTLTYDGALAKLRTVVVGRKTPDQPLLGLDAEVRIKATDLLSGGVVPWTAKLDAKLENLPLDLLVVDSGIGGKAGGELHVDHINDPAAGAATIDGRIDVEKLTVGDAVFDETYLKVKVDETAAVAELAVHGKDGKLDGKARVPLTWKNAASPSIATGATIDATLDATDLRLKIAEPFVPALDALDGKLNAHVTAKMTKNADGHFTDTLAGKLTLREGVVIADAVGERWEHVEADLRFHNNRIDLPKLELRGRTGGTAKLSGHATLDGFMPSGFHARVDTKRFSFASEGVRVGDITGTIVVDGKTVARDDKRTQMIVDVTLDDMTIDLAAEAGKQVQQLDADPSILVAQALGPPIEPPPPAGTGTPIKVTVHIPHPILVRRDDLRVAINGNPSVDIDGPAKIAGELRIEANPASNLQQRSWVEVMGKRFYIQQSRIAFQGNEELDPKLDVEVRWQAPDRSIVQIRVTGNLSAPKVQFKALDESGSPLGLTRGEVMSLLVLGRRDAGSARQQQAAEKGAAAQAASLVQGMTGAIFGKQLQKMLPTSMSLSLAPGRYSGGYQHDNIYFEVAYNSAGARMGPQAIGQTVPRTTFGIEWRFHKMWSLMTTIGDTGSTLVDLLWHYRY